MAREAVRTLSTKKELQETLDRKNTVRAFLSALIHLVAIPVLILIIRLTDMYGGLSSRIIIYLAVCEGVQLVFAVWGYYVISRNEMDRRVFYNNSCFFVTVLCIVAMAGIDRYNTGSFVFYLLGLLYAALVPIMQRGLRRLYGAVFAAGSVASVLIARASGRSIADAALIGLAAFIACDTVHNCASEYVRMGINLRAKTITSEKDPLTGLMNRRGLDKNAAVLWPYCSRTSTPVGIIEIDIDFFKKYNDRFGHPAGDRCLKLIAKSIKQSARRSSDITARTGGEEFLIFVQGMSEEEIIDFAMKIRGGINDLKIPHAYAGVSNYVTVSMGTACCVPNALNSFDELYEEADRALYTAKQNGRNCVVSGNRIYGRMKKGLATVISS
ncbi:MAG: GGDEF domain-containing protein [Butyrivibrio sp.]|nr:GGDEF domain-containing protein [Butyrivibrio sp.]